MSDETSFDSVHDLYHTKLYRRRDKMTYQTICYRFETDMGRLQARVNMLQARNKMLDDLVGSLESALIEARKPRTIEEPKGEIYGKKSRESFCSKVFRWWRRG